jgi:hypothetical protein
MLVPPEGQGVKEKFYPLLARIDGHWRPISGPDLRRRHGRQCNGVINVYLAPWVLEAVDQDQLV